MPTKKGNSSNQASKHSGRRDTTGRPVADSSSGQKAGPPAINRAGASANFRTLVSDALRQELTEISRPAQRTEASMIADEIVGKAATKVNKRGTSKALLMVVNTPTNRIEAKSGQRILTDDIATADPEKRHERIKELLTRGLERSAEEFDR